MIAASKIAGLFAAHAIWCVSDGDMLIPMLVYANENDERNMERLVHDDLVAAVENGKKRLACNEMDAIDASLIYDARITIEEEKKHALIVEMRCYFSPESEAVMAIPYIPKRSGSFRIQRPMMIVWKNCDDFDYEQAIQSFYSGFFDHEKGAAIWKKCYEETN